MRRWSARRVLAGGFACGLTSLVGAASAPAQEFGFRSLGAAEDAAVRIMEASGLRADFEIVVEEGSNNAAAGVASPCGNLRGCRVIVYDPEFLRNIERRTDRWGPISVMAHEVAHHLQGHTVFGEGSNPPNELDADFYSGFVLQQLGASLESAQAAMRLIADPSGSSSHPPRRERLQAIAMGWRKAAAAGGAGGGSAGEALDAARAELEAMRAELRRVEGELADSTARADAAQAARAEAEEALRALRARGAASDAEIRAAEARVRDADARVRAAQAEIQEAQAAQAAAEEALAAAVAANARFGEQAEAAAATADRALLLTALLVPLVLVALVLSLRKPRREVMDRASRVIRWSFRRRQDGSIDPHPHPGLEPGPRPPWPLPPARPFDGSGLERCAEPGGFVLGRAGTLVDAVLDHRSVSRRHARLTRVDGRLCVEDLNSTNGTRVNGRRLDPFVPVAIAREDTVAVGDVDLAFESE